MYNIIQLNDKDLSELQQIAKELGLKKTSTLRKEELVYRILDEQAIVGATKKAAAAKANEERKEGQPRKRSRISVKKEGDKVYTATKDKAQKLEANTPPLPAPAPIFKDEISQPAEVQTETTNADTVAEKPKAKRGRKPGSKNKTTLEKEQLSAPKETEKQTPAVPAPVPVPMENDDMELPALNLTGGDDFIPIEDLPSEKIELPTELLGKFEATKMDTAAPVPAEKPEKENKPNNNKYQARQQRYNNNNNRNNNNNQAGRQQQQHQNTNHPAPQNTTANLPAPQPVVAEQVVQQPKPVEKPYEFDDILSDKQSAEKEYTVEEKLSTLYQLQTMMTEIDKIKTLRGELPLEVQDLEDEIAGLETRLQNYQAEIKEFEASVVEQKHKITESTTLIDRYKAQLDNVRNNREFDNLSKEIEFQGLEIEFSEKKIREFGEAVDAKKKDIAELTEKLEGRKADLVQKKSELEQIISETKQDEEKLREKAKKLEATIEPRLLTAFKRIRKGARNGLAVVYVQRGACGGCFNKIPPQKQLDIKLRKKIIVCEYCGRIMIDPELAGVED